MGRDIQGGEEGHMRRGHTGRRGGAHGEGTYREERRGTWGGDIQGGEERHMGRGHTERGRG